MAWVDAGAWHYQYCHYTRHYAVLRGEAVLIATLAPPTEQHYLVLPELLRDRQAGIVRLLLGGRMRTWVHLHNPWAGQWASAHHLGREVLHWTCGGHKMAGFRHHADPLMECHILQLDNWDDRDIRAMAEEFIEA